MLKTLTILLLTAMILCPVGSEAIDVPPSCDMAFQYPDCNPCWTTCYFALICFNEVITHEEWEDW